MDRIIRRARRRGGRATRGIRPRKGAIIDCSHGNSGKDAARQPGDVLRDIVGQRASGTTFIVGAMLESNLVSGSQPFPKPPANPGLRPIDHGRLHRLGYHGTDRARSGGTFVMAIVRRWGHNSLQSATANRTSLRTIRCRQPLTARLSANCDSAPLSVFLASALLETASVRSATMSQLNIVPPAGGELLREVAAKRIGAEQPFALGGDFLAVRCEPDSVLTDVLDDACVLRGDERQSHGGGGGRGQPGETAREGKHAQQ